ncbi:MAG TPA: phosphate ABC transporter substrate-binding protein PstS [Pyrinomonadaceae bacterium]|jgi:phosphate ABC transporter, phosphate-binding protein|nr:phosphate ABC transporter substrate-binding protein PstS [Pyrinomonadaceae bacterium]
MFAWIRSFQLVVSLAVLSFLLVLGGCVSGGGGADSGPIQLQGAGATFPNPLYQKWLSEYGKLHTNVKIDYQSIGSGGGIKQIQAQTVDFGASDTPMKDEDLKAAPAELLHIPTVLGAVVITYNLEGTPTLHFSPEVIADIFLGKIKKWNDPKIAADNGGAKLPAADITVVHRSDGSGTSAVFTDYLSKVSSEWKEKVGTGPSPSWPVGIGGKGNEGVTGQVKNTPNTIGYVELIYAVQNKLPVAQVKNAAGVFIEPTVDSVIAAAAASASSVPDDLRVSITNAQGAQVYPISSFTYVLIYKNQKDAKKGKALVDFLWWGIHDGENDAKQLQYAPLPPDIVKRAEAKLNSITAGGTPLR